MNILKMRKYSNKWFSFKSVPSIASPGFSLVILVVLHKLIPSVATRIIDLRRMISIN